MENLKKPADEFTPVNFTGTVSIVSDYNNSIAVLLRHKLNSTLFIFKDHLLGLLLPYVQWKGKTDM